MMTKAFIAALSILFMVPGVALGDDCAEFNRSVREPVLAAIAEQRMFEGDMLSDISPESRALFAKEALKQAVFDIYGPKGINNLDHPLFQVQSVADVTSMIEPLVERERKRHCH